MALSQSCIHQFISVHGETNAQIQGNVVLFPNSYYLDSNISNEPLAGGIVRDVLEDEKARIAAAVHRDPPLFFSFRIILLLVKT